MKKLLIIFGIIIMYACDTENGWDCIQTEGQVVEQEVPVTAFNKILVNRNVQLFVKTASNHKVTIETGENLLSDIKVKIVNNQLQLTDNNTCNLIRPYNSTKIYVEAPNISEIRNSSQYEVRSQGTLTYSDLRLISEDFEIPGNFTIGDFRLEVVSSQLDIISNNLSSFYINGTTESLYVGFFSGSGRFEGEDLIAQDVEIYHRGSNDMTVNPQQILHGELRGTGDLISVNQPPVVDVTQFYTGELIFEN